MDHDGGTDRVLVFEKEALEENPDLSERTGELTLRGVLRDGPKLVVGSEGVAVEAAPGGR